MKILIHTALSQAVKSLPQVIIRVEPKLLAALEETSHLKEIIQSDRKKINQISDELALTTHNLEVTQAQLREKEVQWTQLKRCRFCAGGDDQGRDSRGRKGKHGSGIEGKHGVGASGGSAVGDDGSFGFEKSHQRGKLSAARLMCQFNSFNLHYVLQTQLHLPY